MKKTIVLVLLALTYSIAASWAQGTNEQASGTKLEALSSKTGVVVIRGLAPVGALNGKAGDGTSPAHVLIFAVEYVTDGNLAKLQGIEVSVSERDRTARFSIDYDEIEGLLRAVDLFRKADGKATKFKDIEAKFLTRGGLRLVTFPSAKPDVYVIETSSVTVGFDGPEFDKFKEILAKAKGKLDEHP